jgi:hypothetical protein
VVVAFQLSCGAAESPPAIGGEGEMDGGSLFGSVERFVGPLERLRAPIDMHGAAARTVEQGVQFWLMPENSDDEGAVATDSFGMHDFYLTLFRDRTRPLFHTADASHTLYRGVWGSDAQILDGGTVRRSGASIVFAIDGVRYGSPANDCVTQIPNVAVQCSGTTRLLGRPPVLDPDGG